MQKLLITAFILSMFCVGCSNEENETQSNTDVKQLPSLPPQSKLNEAGTQKLMTVVADYYALKDALVATNAVRADEAAQKLALSSDSLRQSLQSDSSKGQITTLLDTVINSSKYLVAEKDETTEKKRIHFEKVSDAMYALLKHAELKNAGIYRQYCPMAFNDKGAYWLSNEAEIKNPYFGKKMLECGEVTDSLK